jgi:hypothetical protein
MITGLKAAILIAVILALGSALLWAATLLIIEGIDLARWLRAVVRDAKAAEKATIE